MIRLFLLALAAVVIVAVGYVSLPRNTARPDPHIADPAPAGGSGNGFVVHEAAPPAAPLPPVPSAGPLAGQATATQAPAANTPDLDSVMQRLRAAGSDPASSPAPAPLVATAPPALPPAPLVVTPASPPPPSTAASAGRWTSVTAQGARWRIVPSGNGFTVAIDLGAGRVASVHVAPAFANLDSTAINQRVDYLKQTILQNFPPESASYTFARDGSVSVDN